MGWLRETVSKILGSTSIVLVIMALLVGATPASGYICVGCGGTCAATVPPGCVGGTCTNYYTCQIFGCTCQAGTFTCACR
jgi:hypothetical protein